MITPRSPSGPAGSVAILAATRRMTLNVPTRLIWMTRAKSASVVRAFLADDALAQHDAGAVDRAVEATETRYGRLDRGGHAGFIGDIGPRETAEVAPSSLATFSPRELTSASTTRAPAATKRLAVASPKPDAPPVMMNTLPASCIDPSHVGHVSKRARPLRKLHRIPIHGWARLETCPTPYFRASRTRCPSSGRIIFSRARRTPAGEPGMVSTTFGPISPPTARLSIAAGPISWWLNQRNSSP